jgi:hypothetical protein
MQSLSSVKGEPCRAHVDQPLEMSAMRRIDIASSSRSSFGLLINSIARKSALPARSRNAPRRSQRNSFIRHWVPCLHVMGGQAPLRSCPCISSNTVKILEISRDNLMMRQGCRGLELVAKDIVRSRCRRLDLSLDPRKPLSSSADLLGAAATTGASCDPPSLLLQHAASRP